MTPFTTLAMSAFLLALAPQQPPPTDADSDRALAVRQAVVNWIECEECTDGELKAVLGWGRTAVPVLVATLKEGPSPARREAHRRHLQETYRALQDYGKEHPNARVAMSEEEYVKTYLGNYEALYAARSARALSALGGSDAKKALEEALRNPSHRADVKDALRTALRDFGRPPR